MAGDLYPIFLDLRGKPVVVVGAGPVGAHKALGLLQAGAAVTVVAPDGVDAVEAEAAAGRLRWVRRAFVPADLERAWLVVAATGDPRVNAAVAAVAAERGVFVNSVDNPQNANAYTGSVLRRGPVTVALSTGGRAPAVCRLLRQLLETVLPEPDELEHWVQRAQSLRPGWRAGGVPVERRFAALLRDLLRTEEGAQP